MALPAIIDKWLGRTSNAISLWPILVPAGVIGALAGSFSQSVAWISQWGAFGWLCVFVAASGVAVGVIGAAVWARHRWTMSSAIKKWSTVTDSVNPLDTEFIRKRINIADIVSPIDKSIMRKRFVDSEIIGPMNLVFIGGGSMSNSTFLEVDVSIIREGVSIFNVAKLIECNIIGCRIYRCTLYISQEMFDKDFGPMGATSISYPKGATTTPQQPLGIGSGTPL